MKDNRDPSLKANDPGADLRISDPRSLEPHRQGLAHLHGHEDCVSSLGVRPVKDQFVFEKILKGREIELNHSPDKSRWISYRLGIIGEGNTPGFESKWGPTCIIMMMIQLLRRIAVMTTRLPTCIPIMGMQVHLKIGLKKPDRPVQKSLNNRQIHLRRPSFWKDFLDAYSERPRDGLFQRLRFALAVQHVRNPHFRDAVGLGDLPTRDVMPLFQAIYFFDFWLKLYCVHGRVIYFNF
jgi:hypothetical protein